MSRLHEQVRWSGDTSRWDEQMTRAGKMSRWHEQVRWSGDTSRWDDQVTRAGEIIRLHEQVRWTGDTSRWDDQVTREGEIIRWHEQVRWSGDTSRWDDQVTRAGKMSRWDEQVRWAGDTSRWDDRVKLSGNANTPREIKWRVLFSVYILRIFTGLFCSKNRLYLCKKIVLSKDTFWRLSYWHLSCQISWLNWLNFLQQQSTKWGDLPVSGSAEHTAGQPAPVHCGDAGLPPRQAGQLLRQVEEQSSWSACSSPLWRCRPTS